MIMRKENKKMKTTIKFFALIIATLMFIFTLSSCMESPETTTSSETTPPSETTTSSETTPPSKTTSSSETTTSSETTPPSEATPSTEQSVARPSLNPDEAYAMLQSNGFSMSIGSSGTTYEGELRSVSGLSGSNIVLIRYFENASYADAAYATMKSSFIAAGYTIEKYENMIYAGLGNGIEAASKPLNQTSEAETNTI